MENIEKTISEILVDKLCVSETEVKLSANLEKDLGMDSLDVVEIIMAIEREYKITISDLEAEKIVTVEDMVNITIDLT